MKTIKAKFYIESELIVPLPPPKPNLIALDEPTATFKQEFSGIDELGEWVLIDFVQDKDAYFDYDIKNVRDAKGRIVHHQVKQSEVNEQEFES